MKNKPPIATGKKGRPEPTDLLVGQNLRTARTLRGMSQDTLAGHAGITFQQIQKYERGTNRVSASKLDLFSRVLDVPIQFFFQGLQQVKGSELIDEETLKIAVRVQHLNRINKVAVRKLIDAMASAA